MQRDIVKYLLGMNFGISLTNILETNFSIASFFASGMLLMCILMFISFDYDNHKQIKN